MSDKKHIDRLFQEKFKDFEVAPNDAVWSRISASLPSKKKKRRAVIWWQMAGVAAAIALLITAGVSILDSEGSNQSLPVVDTKTEESIEKSSRGTKDDKPSDNKQNDLIKNGALDASLVESIQDTEAKKLLNQKEDDKKKQLITPNLTQGAASSSWSASTKGAVRNEGPKQDRAGKEAGLNQNSTNVVGNATQDTKVIEVPSTSATAKVDSEIEKLKTSANTSVAATSASNPKKEASLEETTEDTELKNTIKTQSIEEAIANQTDITNEEEEERNRWSIAPNVAPVYFSSLGQGSPIHDQFNGNSKGSDVSMSYGVAGSYAVSKRLKVRAGISRLNLNQTTSDVIVFSGAEAAARGISGQMSNVRFKGGMESLSVMSTDIMNRNSTPEVFNTKIPGDLEQRFGFIEVPLELEYRLLDKKFGVNVIGGFSTFFLNENEIYADINGNSTLIGEAENINNTSFSANFGLGMDYSLSKQWNVNLEPMFKYQLNTFNNTSGDFRPFFIGVYTGLSFKF